MKGSGPSPIEWAEPAEKDACHFHSWICPGFVDGSGISVSDLTALEHVSPQLNWGFSSGQEWENLSALMRFWAAGGCRRPILGTYGSEWLRKSRAGPRGAGGRGV